MPPRMSAMIACGSSLRGLSLVTITSSARRAAIRPMSGPLARGRDHPAAEHAYEPSRLRRPRSRTHAARCASPPLLVCAAGMISPQAHAARSPVRPVYARSRPPPEAAGLLRNVPCDLPPAAPSRGAATDSSSGWSLARRTASDASRFCALKRPMSGLRSAFARPHGVIDFERDALRAEAQVATEHSRHALTARAWRQRSLEAIAEHARAAPAGGLHERGAEPVVQIDYRHLRPGTRKKRAFARRYSRIVPW